MGVVVGCGRRGIVAFSVEAGRGSRVVEMLVFKL